MGAFYARTVVDCDEAMPKGEEPLSTFRKGLIPQRRIVFITSSAGERNR
jgi:hypothetical protein